jgi:anti-anti-sigma factor
VNQTSFKPDFHIALRGGGTQEITIEVRGELDSGTCEELLDAFQASLKASGVRELTLDLSRVSFIDSAGTRAVIQIERGARARAVSLIVTPPRTEVTELLRTAGAIERFQLSSEPARATLDRSALLERVDLELPRDPASPARARVEVRQLLSGRERPQVADIVLLVSEIVTNAVVHPRTAGETPIALRMVTYPNGFRVEVEDAGDGFDPSVPLPPAGERGRGLFLVDRFASRWGAGHVESQAGRRFRVWFELDWPDEGDAPTAGE